MISNYVLRTKIDSLKREKVALSAEKDEIIAAMRELGISKQAAWKQKKGLLSQIDELDLAQRNRLASRSQEIQNKLRDINVELRKLYAEDESEKNLTLVKIFSEIFNDDQISEIKKEAFRRMAGEHPFKLNFNIDEGIRAKQETKKAKDIAVGQMEKMIEFRLLLTDIIEKGCERFDPTEFMRLKSPLNRLIIPVKELTKIKQSLFV